jgi:hypothetical protein
MRGRVREASQAHLAASLFGPWYPVLCAAVWLAAEAAIHPDPDPAPMLG